MSLNLFFFGRGPVGQGPGAKKTVICQAISAIWQDKGLKFETKAYNYKTKLKYLIKKISADGRGPTAENDFAHFGPYQVFA